MGKDPLLSPRGRREQENYGMKKNLVLSFSILCTLSLVACPSDLTDPSGLNADFTAAPKSGSVPLEVQFSDLSVTTADTIELWLWDFGDGDSSTQQHPTHTYTDAGSYDVSLTVSTLSGNDLEIKSAFISAVMLPTAAFSADPTSGSIPLDVDFTDVSSDGSAPITEWNWDFGDGTSSSERNPTHRYVSGGSFTVSLQVSSADGSDVTTRDDLIDVNTTILFGEDFRASPTDVLVANTDSIVLGGGSSFGPFVSLFDESGEQLWERFVPEAAAGGADLEFATNGDILLAAGGFLVQYDLEGMRVWGTAVPGREGVESSITTSEDGTIYLVNGVLDRFNVLLSTFDSSGNLLESREVPDVFVSGGFQALTQAGNGDFVIAGSSADLDSVLVRMSPQGETLWISTPHDFSAKALVGNGRDSFYLVGTGQSFRAMSAARFDADGNQVWRRVISQGESALGATMTADGQLVMVGNNQRDDLNDEVIVVKIDSDGSEVWSRVLENTTSAESAVGRAVAELSNGDLVVAASHTVNGRDRSGYLIRLSSDGDIVWSK